MNVTESGEVRQLDPLHIPLDISSAVGLGMTHNRDVLEPLDRDPINLETLQLFRRVTGSSSRLDDPETVEGFLAQISEALAASKDNRTRLRGIRTQALFAQLVLALDACELMLTVDAGDIYADGPISSGDFLLVLRDGRRLLVEVKTVSRSSKPSGDLDLIKSQRRAIRAKDVEGLRRAANLLGAEPYVAAYFEFMHMWSLVREKDLSRHGANYKLQFSHDMMHNHMTLLGDRTFGVEKPIELRLYPHEGAQPKHPVAHPDGSVPFEVATRVVYVGGAPVSEPSDSDFAL